MLGELFFFLLLFFNQNYLHFIQKNKKELVVCRDWQPVIAEEVVAVREERIEIRWQLNLEKRFLRLAAFLLCEREGEVGRGADS